MPLVEFTFGRLVRSTPLKKRRPSPVAPGTCRDCGSPADVRRRGRCSDCSARLKVRCRLGGRFTDWRETQAAVREVVQEVGAGL